jgi:cytoskeleton protein RodZ
MTETDEEFIPTTSVGQRLRAAREEKGLSLDEVATQTRIPLRHLQSLEESDWSRLPAATYTIGFAKSYASVVGLDRTEVAEDLRAEMGGTRPDSMSAEVFQPADPARTMPKWLVLSAIGAIILLVLVMSWLNNRSLEPEEAPAPETAEVTTPQQRVPETAPVQTPAPAPAASAPVVLTATGEAWIRVTDQGRTLFEGVLQPGQRFEVPATATAPLLRAGAPEALRITVGNAVAPPVGSAGVVASDISLKPADLMRGPAQPVPPAPSAPPGVQNTAG